MEGVGYIQLERRGVHHIDSHVQPDVEQPPESMASDHSDDEDEDDDSESDDEEASDDEDDHPGDADESISPDIGL